MSCSVLRRLATGLQSVRRKEIDMEYFIKGIIKAGGQAFCFYVLLPLWYAYIKISEYFKKAVKGFDNQS